MTTPTFKFTWVSNSAKVTAKDRPTNELDKQPGYIDSNSIEGLAKLFADSPEYTQLKQKLETAEFKTSRRGKPQRYNQMPKMKKIAIRYLLSALAVQRKINFEHLIRIITTWDSRRPATINIIKLPKSNTCYITDGQHTVLAIALRAKLGMFPDINPEDWLDIEVNCQVVETGDFSFAREHFLGINGDDKLPINPFETHKIHVFSKRLDSPDKETQEKYELASRIQTELECWNLIPVHPDSPERFKSGSVTHVNLLKKLDVADVRFFGNNHSTYWDQEPLDSMEMLPFQDLRRRLEKDGEDFDSVDHKQFMQDLNTIVKEIAGGWAEFKNLTQRVYPEYYRQARNEDPNGVPKDASLVLMLQLYEKAGGTHLNQFKGMTSFITRYNESNTNMFKQLDVATRGLFK
jgi:hypothetical protein